MTGPARLSDSQRDLLTARLRRARPASVDAIGRRPAGGQQLPLSFAQEQLWFIDQLVPDSPAYNIPLALRLTGRLQPAALARALDALVARHEALRTRLVTGPDGTPAQLVDEPAGTELAILDLSKLPAEAAERSWRDAAASAAGRPFRLSSEPLLRCRLIRLAADAHVLLLVVHHAVFDGWSCTVLVTELMALYQAELTGQPAGLAELPVQFADYALWERQRLQGEPLAELLEHWRTTLAGSQPLQLPTDRPRPVLDSFEGAVHWHNLGAEPLHGVRALARQLGSTPFVVLLSALQVLLHRYTGQQDIVVGTPSANRGRPELAPLIGFLVNMLPIRTDLSGDPSFEELVRQVHRNTQAAYAHQELPFSKLVEGLRVERDPGRAPVFQVGMTFVEQAVEVRLPGLLARLETIDLPATKFDLDFFARVRTDELWLELSYTTALFDQATIERLAGHFEVLLAGALADPSRRLSELPLLPATELHRVLVEWNQTGMDFPLCCAQVAFEQQVELTPDAVAAQLAGERVSYAELNAGANQMARRIRQFGVGPEVLVGVSMAPTIRRLVVLLAILKAGGGYLPLDPALPAERLAFMIADAEAPLVLADESSLAGVPETAATVLVVDHEWAEIALFDKANLPVANAPSDAAYVIYTSGSTGQPKGVVVEHRQLINFVHAMRRHWPLGPTDRVLQFASLNFDASVLEMFLPLLGGASVVLGSRESLLSPPRLTELMREQRVTLACLTPAVANLLSTADFPELRVLLVVGERLPAELVRDWLRPGLRIYNGYGPTENTVISTIAELDGTEPSPPIGRPVANQQAYVLDSRLNPVPVGVPGELYLGGAGVTRGYLNRPELTTERFVPDPFGTDPAGRLYRSGDLVSWTAAGELVFHGRIDGQVKIRGLRVELGEIETALASHPAVSQAVVLVLADQQLVGYLLAEPGVAAPGKAELAELLASWLPAYMVPSQFVVLPEFPLNSSGKVDRARLPAPELAAAPAGQHTAPRGRTERLLTGIYVDLLGAEQVGIDDSFFDLGGHSLRAMQLIARVRTELAADLGVTDVFLAPTPRQLAARIDSASTADPTGVLVELTDGPAERPWFIVHAIAGSVFGYAALAGELADTFKVYGVQAAGLSAGSAAESSLDRMARNYLRAIREVQPAGPYRLAGWSMGGLLAFEIAQQLERDGERVESLVLLDAPFAMPADGGISEVQLAAQFVADAGRTLGWPATESEPASVADQLASLADRLAADGADAEAVHAELRRRFAVFAAHRQAIAGYRPAGSVRASTLLIGAEDSPNAAAQRRWPEVLTGPVSTSYLPGDHYSFLQAGAVPVVAALIRQAANRVVPACE